MYVISDVDDKLIKLKFLLVTIFTGIDYCPVLEYSCSTFSPRSAIYERRAAEPGAGCVGSEALVTN